MRRGATLYEVMLATVVVSVSAAIAVPSYVKRVEGGRKTEGHHVLLLIRNAEMRYHAEHSRFTGDWNDLEIEDPNTNPRRYFNYNFSCAGTSNLLAEAHRLGGSYKLTITETATITEQVAAASAASMGTPVCM